MISIFKRKYSIRSENFCLPAVVGGVVVVVVAVVVTGVVVVITIPVVVNY